MILTASPWWLSIDSLILCLERSMALLRTWWLIVFTLSANRIPKHHHTESIQESQSRRVISPRGPGRHRAAQVLVKFEAYQQYTTKHLYLRVLWLHEVHRILRQTFRVRRPLDSLQHVGNSGTAEGEPAEVSICVQHSSARHLHIDDAESECGIDQSRMWVHINVLLIVVVSSQHPCHPTPSRRASSRGE